MSTPANTHLTKPFDALMGTRRGLGSYGSRTPADPSTRDLLIARLLNCGWSSSRGGEHTYWVKGGHANTDRAGAAIGVKMTLADAISDQMIADDLLSAGWWLRPDGKWELPRPFFGDPHPELTEPYVCDHAREAGVCQYAFDRC